jgi:hypothetical protein
VNWFTFVDAGPVQESPKDLEPQIFGAADAYRKCGQLTLPLKGKTNLQWNSVGDDVR